MARRPRLLLSCDARLRLSFAEIRTHEYAELRFAKASQPQGNMFQRPRLKETRAHVRLRGVSGASVMDKECAELRVAKASQPHGSMLQRPGLKETRTHVLAWGFGCVGHRKGAWGGTGGLVRSYDFAI